MINFIEGVIEVQSNGVINLALEIKNTIKVTEDKVKENIIPIKYKIQNFNHAFKIEVGEEEMSFIELDAVTNIFKFWMERNISENRGIFKNLFNIESDEEIKKDVLGVL